MKIQRFFQNTLATCYENTTIIGVNYYFIFLLEAMLGLETYRTIKELLESEGKNGEDRGLFNRMRNKGEVYEVEVDGVGYYVKQKDIEKLYVLSLNEGVERMRWCLEAMRELYDKKIAELGSKKEEKAKSLYETDTKVKTADGWKADE